MNSISSALNSKQNPVDASAETETMQTEPNLGAKTFKTLLRRYPKWNGYFEGIKTYHYRNSAETTGAIIVEV